MSYKAVTQSISRVPIEIAEYHYYNFNIILDKHNSCISLNNPRGAWQIGLASYDKPILL